MALLDDLHRMASAQGIKNKIWAVKSAIWIFERNPWLSLDQQAEGIAFLVAAFLREKEAKVRDQYTQTLCRIIQSRPYQVGAQIGWATLTSALPHLPSGEGGTVGEVGVVLYLLRYATDERYLSLLERYFDDVEHYHWAVSSWAILAYTQRYTYDKQVLPYLQEAQKVIEGRFDEVRRRVQKKLHRVVITRKEFLHNEPWFRSAKAWAMQQFAEAEQQIRQHVQVRDRRAFMRAYEENKLYQADPDYLPTLIQSWLALSSREEKLQGGLGRWRDTFHYSLSLPIDEVAQSVKILVDYVLSEEDPSLRSLIWGIIATAFEARRYVGTHLDWDRLADVLSRLNEDREDPQYHALINLLFCFGRANDTHSLERVKPFLDHHNIHVRRTAVEVIKDLLWHLAHYCPEATSLLIEAADTFKPQKGAPETPERWQMIKDRLEQLEHDIRPYFHYYSI
jgi:hypothetical protein